MAPASQSGSRLLVPLLTLSVVTILLALSSTAHGEISTLSKVFHRHRPRNVSVEAIGDNSLKVTWEPPRVNTARCPVKRYLIRLRHDTDKQHSKAWNVDGARHSLSLHDLTEDATYYVRLVAITCRGKSRPTKWFRVNTTPRRALEDEPANTVEDGAPNKPTYVRTRTYSDSVVLLWRPPTGDTLVRGYMVGYGEGVPDVNWRYVSSASRNVTITGLKPARQYVITLRAFNNYGKGPVVYDLVYTREKPAIEDSTSLSPPDNLRAKILSPSTAWLQWVDPSLGRHQQITDNRYYNVHYQPLVGASKSLSVIVKAFHVVLYDLLSGTRYTFKVRTVKDGNASDFSERVANRTFEKAPGTAPRSVQVLAGEQDDSAYITWRAPKQPNGAISGYLVLYSTSLSDPAVTWLVRAVTGDNDDVTIRGLASNTTHYFKIQARNSAGYGPLSLPVNYTTLAESPESTQSLDRFTTTEDTNSAYGNTKVIRIPIMAPRPRNEPIYAASIPSEVHPDMQIAASHQGFDASDTERTSTELSSRSKRKRPTLSFQSLVQHTVSAVVSWSTGCGDMSENVLSYVIRYNPIGEAANYVDKIVRTTFVVLENLRPNTRYHYQIKYVLEDLTETAWSNVGVLDTSHTEDTANV